MGHARAILSVEDPKIQLKLYKQVIKEGLSVRAVEELGRKLAGGENHDAPAKVKSEKSADIRMLEKDLHKVIERKKEHNRQHHHQTALRGTKLQISAE